MPRATQQNHANENLPAQQQQQQERKVIEREKPYEFDDILNGVGVLEIMQDGYGFLRSSDYNYLLLRTTFMYHNLKSNSLV
mgnify:CR=1 FL=1